MGCRCVNDAGEPLDRCLGTCKNMDNINRASMTVLFSQFTNDICNKLNKIERITSQGYKDGFRDGFETAKDILKIK